MHTEDNKLEATEHTKTVGLVHPVLQLHKRGQTGVIPVDATDPSDRGCSIGSEKESRERKNRHDLNLIITASHA